MSGHSRTGINYYICLHARTMNDEVQSEEIFSKIENKFHVSCRILFVSEYIFLS
jgi:hypothetical protein